MAGMVFTIWYAIDAKKFFDRTPREKKKLAKSNLSSCIRVDLLRHPVKYLLPHSLSSVWMALGRVETLE